PEWRVSVPQADAEQHAPEPLKESHIAVARAVLLHCDQHGRCGRLVAGRAVGIGELDIWPWLEALHRLLDRVRLACQTLQGDCQAGQVAPVEDRILAVEHGDAPAGLLTGQILDGVVLAPGYVETVERLPALLVVPDDIRFRPRNVEPQPIAIGIIV